MDLSIVIPAYNEEKRIKESLNKITTYLNQEMNGLSWEILVVNDGSRDDTAKIVKEIPTVILVSYEHNRGKGYAVKTGMLQSCGEKILLTDADLSTPISELGKFLGHLKDNDIVIGSRRMKNSKIKLKQPFYRQMLGKGFGMLTKWIFLPGINDSQCGFKLFKKEIAQKVFAKQKINGFSFDVEILYLAKKMFNAKIVEIPIEWTDSPKFSKVNGLRDTFRMLKDLIRIRWIHRHEP